MTGLFHLGRVKAFVPWVGTIAPAVVFILFLSGHTKSAAVDLAHNHALTHRIRQLGLLFESNDLSLGEMNVYPRGAHFLTSTVGNWFGSSFIGLHLVGLVAVGIIFSAIAIGLGALPKKLAVHVGVIFVLLLVANHFGPQFETHGSELVGTFFFSQLIGFSLLAVSIVVSGRLEARHSDIWAIVSLSVSSVLVATIHLLPALIGLGVAWLLAIVSAIGKTRLSSSEKPVALVTRVALSPLIASMAILLLPSTRAMREIAEHDGGLILNHIPYPWGVFTLIALTGVVSVALSTLWLLRQQVRELMVVKYVSALGLVTAGLGTAQFAALQLGMGSPYAVKKYSYGLTTILFLELALLIGLASARLLNKEAGPKLSSIARGGLSAATVFALFFPIAQAPEVLNVSNMMKLEEDIISLGKQTIPPDSLDLTAAVMDIEDLPRSMNYMFSIGLLSTPRSLAEPGILRAGVPEDLSPYGIVVTSRNGDLAAPQECILAEQNSLVAVDIQCSLRTR